MNREVGDLLLLVVGNFHKARSSDAFANKLSTILSLLGTVEALDHSTLGALRLPRFARYTSSNTPAILRGFRYILIQFEVSRRILAGGRVDALFVLQALMCLPVITARVKEIPCAVMTVQRLYGEGREIRSVVSRLKALFERISLTFSTKVVIESLSIGEVSPANHYKPKLVLGPVYVDRPENLTVSPPSKRPWTIAYVGQLSRTKGFDTFIRSIDEVLRSRPKTRFLIVGEGELEALARHAADSDARVDYIPGTDHQNVFYLLSKARLLILPSLAEGVPNIILEAMAMSTVVVATPVGGIPDIVKEGTTGFLIREPTPHSLAQRMIEAMDSRELDAISLRASRLVEQQFSLDSAVKCYERVVELMRMGS